ncbi:MAG: NAD-dependent epimerase/dehydratase family protein, partial [Bacteroidetes bacterium]|nr:NAD-dependent epimerase/dehydratase family protein [Bacteroidota bacterium]
MYEKAFQSEDLTQYSFLVTGGAGFIGSNIVEYLVKQGAGKIRVLDNLATGFKENLQ